MMIFKKKKVDYNLFVDDKNKDNHNHFQFSMMDEILIQSDVIFQFHPFDEVLESQSWLLHPYCLTMDDLMQLVL